MKHEEFLKQVKERSEVVKRSDDFGHDTQALLCWESGEYQFYVEDAVPKLLAIIEKLNVAMVDIANKNTCWRLYEIDKYKSYEDGWEGVAEFANKTLKELDEIVGQG